MFVGLVFWVGGCATLISNATRNFAADLSDAILNSSDLEMVRDGAPAYLILIDGLLARSPDNVYLLSQAASLNAAYAAAFVADPQRQQRLQSKALDLASRAVCLGVDDGCDIRTRPFDRYEAWLAERDVEDVELLYGLGTAWAGWIQSNSDDWGAIAHLAQVKALMLRVIELEEGFDHGGAHLYTAVFESQVPPALGGRPEVARAHFERAVELSDGKHLLTKVFYAEEFARMVFDRELHDRLLSEVVAADPQVDGLTLINVIAQAQAIELLESADEYF